MDNKVLRKLEYHKIMDKLAQQASTFLGKQRVAALMPLSHIDEVNHRLQATEEASQVIRLKGHPPFSNIEDIVPALKRAKIGGMLNPKELIHIANVIYAGKRLVKFLNAVEEKELPILEHLWTQMQDLQHVEQAITQCINESGEIVDHATSALAQIRRELRLGESRVRDKLMQMIKSPNTLKKLQDGILTIRNERYVIPVKQEYRSHFGGIIHDQSSSGATLYIEPEVIVNMNNKLKEWKLKEEREIEKILIQLSHLIEEEQDNLHINLDMIGHIDFIFAKAKLSNTLQATLPKVNDQGYLKLKQARHPLIRIEDVVPCSIELGGTYTSMLITGPNTGGKTVTLKTVGLLSLMAMSGLFIPVEDGSEISVFEGVYADIGDEQSIEQNLSTFSSHLTNIIHILERMTPNSLILLDEVGAGTDPTEGAALAISIIEHIYKRQCRLIATTHYSELKAYAYDREGIINASMEFDVDTLSPTYRLLIGIPGRSNAFNIAQRLGLSQDIILDAKSKVNHADQKVDTMIANLEENRVTAEAERKEAEQIRTELQQLRHELEREKESQAQMRAKVMNKAQDEAAHLVKKAQKEAESIIQDLRKLALEEQTSMKEHKLIQAKKKLEEAIPEKEAAPKPKKKNNQKVNIEAGDEVFVEQFNQKGFVIDVINEKELTVQLGIMKMKVRKDGVELIQKKKQEQSTASRSAILKRAADDPVQMELDLRGKNVEEAYIELDRFIDECVLSNLNQMHIIHGKGTGVLRNGIQQYLRKHKYVKSLRLGEYGEGGSGVTVAQLK
ncbi:endonuclease MutS2 [Longirhabdus pacifica]|uniref:endonuclease MutS2 n=1 Tax=Longirhabdus pacifica TaxID=2305227 RepID=UPI0010086B4C|nr:endonuclease MutS2 [Longirhabdus pacifica]